MGFSPGFVHRVFKVCGWFFVFAAPSSEGAGSIFRVIARSEATWQSVTPAMRSIARSPKGTGKRTDCHGLRPRNDSASGKVVRIRRGAVVHWVHSAERHRGRSLQADFAPLRVGATLAVVPGPTIHGGGAAASRPPYGDSSSTAAN